ncbi:MAG TPA: hypothetical protein VF116_08850 [Ktedonobacterales bacterium]
MSMGDALWQRDDEGATDPDVEWAFFGAHAIEYWVVRDGRLVPADGSDLERIAASARRRRACCAGSASSAMSTAAGRAWSLALCGVAADYSGERPSADASPP